MKNSPAALSRYVATRLHVATPLAALLLLGCNHYAWLSPTKGQEQFYADKYKCEREAANTFPVANVTIPPNPAPQPEAPTQTDCTTTSAGNKLKTNCETKRPWWYVPESKPNPTAEIIDTNAENLQAAFSSCMNASGWFWQEVDKPA